MASGFLGLPFEIRLHIYQLVFGNSNAVLNATRRGDDHYSMLPAETTSLHDCQRSAQLLRVCKTVLDEAQPVLYGNTRFHVIAQAFAGRLPSTATNGHPTMPHVQHLIWQMDCDLLKHSYPDELRLDPTALSHLKSLEIRCRAETWRNSFMGELCDREAFVKGREQTLEYAKILKDTMTNGPNDVVRLVEDRGQLGRGRVILKVERKERGLRDNEILVC